MEASKKSRKWRFKKVKKIGPHSSKYQKDYQNNPNTPQKLNIKPHTHTGTEHTHTHIHNSTQHVHIRTHSTAVCNTLPWMQEHGPACSPVGTAYAIQKWSPPSIPNPPTTPTVGSTVLNRFQQFFTFRNTIKKDVTVVTTGIVQILSAH